MSPVKARFFGVDEPPVPNGHSETNNNVTYWILKIMMKYMETKLGVCFQKGFNKFSMSTTT